MLYNWLKVLVGVFFNTLNLILAGNLPPFGCVCVIVEDHGRYLVIAGAKSDCTFPSGFMRWRESPSQAALREAMEETGLRLQLGDMIGCYSVSSRDLGGLSTLTIAYCAEVVGGELRGSIEGQPCWLDEAELSCRLILLHRRILDEYLRQRARCTMLDVHEA